MYRRWIVRLASAWCFAALAVGPAAGQGIADAPVTAADGLPMSDSPPYRVLLRSLVVPGWGQLENGQAYKAAVAATVECGLLASAYVELRRSDRSFEAYREASEAGDQAAADRLFAQYEDRRSRAIGRFWWSVFAMMISSLDAYVDAYMRDFEVDTTVEERARTAQRDIDLDVGMRDGDPAVALAITF